MSRSSRKPRNDQPLLPLADTVAPWVEPEPTEEAKPLDAYEEFLRSNWAEMSIEGVMSLDDDEPYTDDELTLMREHPTDYRRTP